MSSPSPNDLTRQQLDELDALLQRMLSLPLSPPAAPLVPPPPAVPAPSAPLGWRFDQPVPATPKPHQPRFADDDLPELAAAVAPLSAESLAAELPLPPSAPARLFGPPTPDTGVPPATEPFPPPGTLRGVDAPALPPGYRPPTPVPEPAAAEPEEEFAELTPAAPTPAPKPTGGRVPVPLWPLFAANWVIETLLGLFGPLGALLTWAPMKHLLGWSGLALLAAAGAWAARGLGWVSW